MKKGILLLTALLLASTTAHAQYVIEYGGHTITIDPDRGTVSIPGVYDNTGRGGKRARTDGKTDSKSDPSRRQQGQQVKSTPQGPAPNAAPSAADPAPPASAAVAPPAAPTQPAPTTAANTPAESAAVSVPPSSVAAPAPAASPPAAAAVAAAPPPPLPPPAAPGAPSAQQPVQAAAPAAIPRDPSSPIGLWLTEEKEGKVRIEACGPNLCGFAVDEHSNQNGEQVLINMKPGKDKWSGRIVDPNSGSTYDSTISLKSPDRLRVQGCAFGGMFCGGQTWTRVN